MSRRERVDDLINRYGSRIEVLSADGTEIVEVSKAIIQPLRYRALDGYCLDTGYFDKSVYWYSGLASCRIDTYPLNTIVNVDDKKYIVKKADKICVEDEIIYISAILQNYEE